MKKILFSIFCLISLNISAQDTIKIMQYNLLYYGDYWACPEEINDISAKTEYLKTIISYVRPDIFTVNEIDDEATDHTFLLNNVFLLNGFPNYSKGTTSTGNQIFYNNDKFTFYDRDYVDSYPSDIDIFKFHYNSPDAEVVDLYCAVAHLKAGNEAGDLTERVNSTNNLMAWIYAYYGAKNILFMGDFNLYTADEVAYQNVINYSDINTRFYDPINMPGDWNNNYSYRYIHTQSTHLNADPITGACPSLGGMDDRFDFILISNNIKNNLNKISYKTGTYKAVGQDGNHYNNNINSGSNTSVPANVLNALFYNSDHLPVYLELIIDQTPTVNIEEISTKSLDIKIQNPVSDYLNFTIYINDILTSDNFKIEVYNLLGNKVFDGNIEKQQNVIEYEIPVSDFQSGLYILRIYDDKNYFYQEKFIKI
jgi:exonuclease III